MVILEFKTKRNTNGHYKYLSVHNNGTYCRENPYITASNAIEAKATDYKRIINRLESQGYTESTLQKEL